MIRKRNRRDAGREDRHRSRRRRPRLETLESRRVPALIVVTTNQDIVDPDDDVVSLREAISMSNDSFDVDSISFEPSLTARGPTAIRLTLGELQITDSVLLNGPDESLMTIDVSNATEKQTKKPKKRRKKG